MYMKKINKRYRYDLVMNEEEHRTLEVLREKYAINISKCFKNFLQQYYDKLNKMDAQNG